MTPPVLFCQDVHNHWQFTAKFHTHIFYTDTKVLDSPCNRLRTYTLETIWNDLPQKPVCSLQPWEYSAGPARLFTGDMSPSGCTVVSGVVGVVVVVVCNRSQTRTGKCTCLIFGVSIDLDPG